MKVIICGAGQVGAQIANHLSLEKIDITVIDSNPDLISQLTNTLDISGIAVVLLILTFWSQRSKRLRCCHSNYSIRWNKYDHMSSISFSFYYTRKIARIRSQSYLEIITGFISIWTFANWCYFSRKRSCWSSN